MPKDLSVSKLLCFALCLLGFSLSLRAQSSLKQEKESPLKEERIPKEADSLIKSHLQFNKLNWILEESAEGESLEAKLKSEKKWISIEFSAEADFQDLEVEIEMKAMEPSVLKLIEGKLKEDFKRFKIQKVQSRYTGELENLLIDKPWEKVDSRSERLIAYELVVFGKEGKDQFVFEYVFDLKGSLISRSKYVSANSDNLIY